jgi:hypothetical protein
MPLGKVVTEKQKQPYRLSINRFLQFAFHGLRAATRGVLILGQVGGLVLMTEPRAWAYTDPGSGLLTLQMLGAWLVGGSIYLRYKLRAVLRGKPSNMANVDLPQADADQESPSQESAGPGIERIEP